MPNQSTPINSGMPLSLEEQRNQAFADATGINAFAPKNIQNVDDQRAFTSGASGSWGAEEKTPVEGAGATGSWGEPNRITYAPQTASKPEVDTTDLPPVVKKAVDDYNLNRANATKTTANVLASKKANQTAPVKAVFEDNPLDTYENITYNFTLSLIPEANFVKASGSAAGYVIAQSGRTAQFSIGRVDVEHAAGPNFRTQNSFGMRFQVEIVEPQGISLIDRILQAASQLNVANPFDSPFQLDLTFKGYQGGIQAEATATKHSYRLRLLDIQTSLDARGTIYQMIFIDIKDYGFHQQSSAALIRQQLNIAATNVGDFFDQLSYLLIRQDAISAANNTLSRNEYQFNIPDDIRMWKLGESSQTPDSPSMFKGKNGEFEIVVKPGTRLQDLVNLVFSTTKEATARANPGQQPSDRLKAPQEGTNICQTYVVQCDVQYIAYNPNNNDYIKKFVYYITPYDALTAVPEKPDDTGQAARASYIGERALRKRYEYIYSGKNTSVLQLDLNFNNLWRHSTSYYTYALHRKGNNASDTITTLNPPAPNTDDLCVGQSAFTPKPIELNYTPIPDANAQFTPIPSAAQQQLNRQNYQQDLLNRLQSANPNGSNNSLSALKSIIDEQDMSKGIVPLEGPTTTVSLSSNGQRITSPAAATLPLVETLQSQSLVNNPMLNFFVRQADIGLDTRPTDQNAEQTLDYGRTIFGIINNQLYGQTGTDLLGIELEIRGDPYWLGESHDEQLSRLSSNKTSEPSPTGRANYMRGENMFFLTFRTPTTYDESTGMMNLNNSNLFLGLYSVRFVHHSFHDGSYTQRISAVRDINTAPQQLRTLVG